MIGTTECRLTEGPLDGLEFTCPTECYPVLIAFYLPALEPGSSDVREVVYDACCAQDPDVKTLEYRFLPDVKNPRPIQ